MKMTPPNPSSTAALTSEQKASISASASRFREKLRQSAEGKIQAGNNDNQRSLRKKLLSSPEILEQFMSDAATRVVRG
jgi:hypothetical protein